MYTLELISNFADQLNKYEPLFPKERFLELVFDSEWEQRELKARYRHITLCLGQLLPDDYPSALGILRRLREECRGFPYMFFPDYIEVFGQAPEHWELSIEALKDFTSMNSSEFAVRPFIQRDPERMLGHVMLAWAQDPSEHVRRLASEGCRPRLPWAAPLRHLQADPSGILPILELLQADESEYVRKSVANNLNDISKDHPELVLQLSKRWLESGNPRTYWIVKHGCRTLLKKGNLEALQLFGFEEEPSGGSEGGSIQAADKVQILDLQAKPSVVALGEETRISWKLVCEEPVSFRLQLAVEYIKANGSASTKRFHLAERKQYQGTSENSRVLSFRDLSTRKHYPGPHRVAILVNGREAAAITIQVT